MFFLQKEQSLRSYLFAVSKHRAIIHVHNQGRLPEEGKLKLILSG